ncbi:hypothetical protein BUALT_Bualt06G0018700 [Buddleja alternifolia]|uniref:Beta-ketoacyl synthase N-terminal domain-containing protein n=1 Tax=Buddleja alternifolia TaxID=168488 RepID=A0AAV6XMR6_9LAMI|nr:hypothetical protein BUALT_Bualt06G0018700 [Buddleja alternifolia]
MARHNSNELVSSLIQFSHFFSSGPFSPPPLLPPRRVVDTGDRWVVPEFGLDQTLRRLSCSTRRSQDVTCSGLEQRIVLGNDQERGMSGICDSVSQVVMSCPMSGSGFPRNTLLLSLGLGMVTPLGCGVEVTWKRLIERDYGVRAITIEDLKMNGFDRETQQHTFDQLTSKVPGVVPCGSNQGEFNEELWFNSKWEREQKLMEERGGDAMNDEDNNEEFSTSKAPTCSTKTCEDSKKKKMRLIDVVSEEISTLTARIGEVAASIKLGNQHNYNEEELFDEIALVRGMIEISRMIVYQKLTADVSAARAFHECPVE